MQYKTTIISTENIFDYYEIIPDQVQVQEIKKNRTILKLRMKNEYRETLKKKEIEKIGEKLPDDIKRLFSSLKKLQTLIINDFRIKSMGEELKEIEEKYSTERKYIAFDIKKLDLKQNEVKIIRRCKYLGIQQPLVLYMHNKNNTYLLFNDILEYQLSDEKLKTLTKYDLNRILVQLILLFNEFEQRNFYWQLSDLSQLYYIEEILQTLVIDYVRNENKYEREQLFKQLIAKHFSKLLTSLKIDIFQQDDQFRNFLKSLMDQEGIKSGLNEVEAAYEQTIKWLLNVTDFKLTYYTPYCIIKQFETPQQIKKLIHNLPERMVFKQKRIHESHKFYIQLRINLEREIEISEKNMEYKQLSSCLFYIRILGKPFLFMKMYKYHLGVILQQWTQRQNIEYQKLKVYHLCESFSTAIFGLRLGNFIHRDLKPQNIFLDDWDENDIEFMLRQQIVIADFDRSKIDDSSKQKGQIEQFGGFSSLYSEDQIQQQESEYLAQQQESEYYRQQDQEKREYQKNIGKIQQCGHQQKMQKTTMTVLNSENTEQYDPPEIEQTFKYDVWQFGLICLSIANKGVFAGYKFGGRGLNDEEYKQYYSLEAIKKTLSHTDYSENFLKLLAQCLEQDYKIRKPPYAEEGKEKTELTGILWKLRNEEYEKYKNAQKKQQIIQQ
ncbi:unnamed protein product [Paramecium octaurelia]|uniref:Protein kinase domain-containing protein n=1 Tax=Paramecium octaurelia TaxID=43137 RepID=A0A8S1U1V0_PAROT|nr:unnamed protein product [Paramecium octaurelia]